MESNNGHVALMQRFEVVDVSTSRTVVFLLLVFSGLPGGGGHSSSGNVQFFKEGFSVGIAHSIRRVLQLPLYQSYYAVASIMPHQVASRLNTQ